MPKQKKIRSSAVLKRDLILSKYMMKASVHILAVLANLHQLNEFAQNMEEVKVIKDTAEEMSGLSVVLRECLEKIVGI